MSEPPQDSIPKIGRIEGAQKLLETLNFSPDQALLLKCLNKASVMIGDIYAEAGKTLPANHAADPQVFEIGDECIAAFYMKYVASTADEKRDAREEIDMCKKAVKLHIGISESGGDTIEIPEPKMFKGQGLTDVT